MDASDMYVPNVNKWMEYYKNIGTGKNNNYNTARSINQRGGSISGNVNEFMIPIDDYAKGMEKESTQNKLSVNLVSPTQQTVEQAESEVKYRNSLKRKYPTASSHLRRKRRRVQSKKSTKSSHLRRKRRRVQTKAKARKHKVKSIKRNKRLSNRKIVKKTKKTAKKPRKAAKRRRSQKNDSFASWLQ